MPAGPAVRVRHISPQIAAALLSQPTDTAERTTGGDGRRVQGTVSGLHADAASGLELPRDLTTRQCVHAASMDDAGARHRHSRVAALVRKLRHDLGAVEGAVRERWSNGPVEGHVNRLKTLRRQTNGSGLADPNHVRWVSHCRDSSSSLSPPDNEFKSDSRAADDRGFQTLVAEFRAGGYRFTVWPILLRATADRRSGVVVPRRSRRSVC